MCIGFAYKIKELNPKILKNLFKDLDDVLVEALNHGMDVEVLEHYGTEAHWHNYTTPGDMFCLTIRTYFDKNQVFIEFENHGSKFEHYKGDERHKMMSTSEPTILFHRWLKILQHQWNEYVEVKASRFRKIEESLVQVLQKHLPQK